MWSRILQWLKQARIAVWKTSDAALDADPATHPLERNPVKPNRKYFGLKITFPW